MTETGSQQTPEHRGRGDRIVKFLNNVYEKHLLTVGLWVVGERLSEYYLTNNLAVSILAGFAAAGVGFVAERRMYSNKK